MDTPSEVSESVGAVLLMWKACMRGRIPGPESQPKDGILVPLPTGIHGAAHHGLFHVVFVRLNLPERTGFRTLVGSEKVVAYG